MKREAHVYLGTITHPVPFAAGAGGEGIVFLALDLETGRLEKRGAYGGVLNPTYVAANAAGTHIYSVTCNLETESHIHAFERGEDGALALAGVQPTGARVGCHILEIRGGGICAVSYMDSSIAVFPARNGALSPREYHIRYRGSSAHPERQEDSHAHQAALSPDGRWLYVCDLGADKIWRHTLHPEGLPETGEPAFTPAPMGSGPRHMVFHPALPCAYVICELNAHLLAFRWSRADGSLALIADLPSLPADWTGLPSGAAIRAHPSGAAVYVSNRVSDTLDYFTLDPAGMPSPAGHIAAGGICPRDFAIDPTGRWLLAANQDSHTLAVHELNPHTGLPIGGAPRLYPVDSPASVLVCEA